MNVTAQTIEGLDAFLKEHLEADIVAQLAEQLDISPAEAMKRYFESPLATAIEEGRYGMQYLDASYLAAEVMKTL